MTSIASTGFTEIEVRNDEDEEVETASRRARRPETHYATAGYLNIHAGRPLAVDTHGERDAYFDPALMIEDHPYRYQLEGIEYIAMRRADGRVDFYEVPIP